MIAIALQPQFKRVHHFLTQERGQKLVVSDMLDFRRHYSTGLLKCNNATVFENHKKISFNITSDVYILSEQKLTKNAKNGQF